MTELASKRRKIDEETSQIPDHLIAERLSRLPLMSLIRCTIVAKSWCSIIHDLSFKELHGSRGPIIIVPGKSRTEEMYYINNSGMATFRCMPISGTTSTRCVFRYSDGLICYKGGRTSLYVCNPTLRETITLPRPFNGSYRFEFGYHYQPCEKKYKVLAWRGGGDSVDYKIFILGTTTWRSVSSRPCGQISEPSVCLNGTLYWHHSDNIISFNLAKEEFGVLPLPREASQGLLHVQSFIFELEGCLCLVDLHLSLKVIQLWVLKDNEQYEHEWMMKTVILPSQCYGIHANFYSQNGDIVIATSYEGEHHLYFYSLQSKRFKRIKIRGLDSGSFSIKKLAISFVKLKKFIRLYESSYHVQFTYIRF